MSCVSVVLGICRHCEASVFHLGHVIFTGSSVEFCYIRLTLLYMPCPVCVVVVQSCLTLCDPMDCGPPGSCPWDPPGKDTGAGYPALLQGIFPTQGPNPGLLHCRQILYYLSHQGSPSRPNGYKNLHVELGSPGSQCPGFCVNVEVLVPFLQGLLCLRSKSVKPENQAHVPHRPSPY